MEDDEYRPRKDDHLVEPFLAGLAKDGAGGDDARRGCLGAASLLLLVILLWL